MRRCEEPGERDDLWIAGGVHGGIGRGDSPLPAVEAVHQSVEVVVVLEPPVPVVADLSGLAEGGCDGLAAVSADQAPMKAIGLQDLWMVAQAGLVVLGLIVVVADPPLMPPADDVFVVVPAPDGVSVAAGERAVGAAEL